ncbi:MAG: class I SAM-dependent methyltransferase [Chloroflexota bacterium]
MRNMPDNDIQRVRDEYADRRKRRTESDVYSPFNPAHLFLVQQRQRRVLETLRRANFQAIDEKRILEVGCGRGRILLEYVDFGAYPPRLHGIDLLERRLQVLHRLLPNAPIACADGQTLPYRAASFDLVMQYTAFSSVLDDRVKQNMALEMLRVVKPNGLILWYDFWTNPRSAQTKGIPSDEIRRLFPNCAIEFQKITLAPPITRRLVKFSWLVCAAAEKLRLLNTHYLAVIRPR